MKQFLNRLVSFALIGFITLAVLLASYLFFDPFKVIWNYPDYSNPYVITNRDYISTTMFIKNHPKYNYNSFIFGSSRTLAFRPDSWLRHLSTNDKPFMFDASNESIYGIYTKLHYLDSTKVKLDNVLILLSRDASFSNSKNHEGHLFIKHPATSGESEFDFQLEFFKAYLSPKFLFNFYSYKIIGEYRPFMAGYIEYRKIVSDTITNEIKIIDQEAEITRNPDEYFLKRAKIFYKRNGQKTDSVKRINERQIFMLKEIKRILKKNKSNYKVVISPLYEQVKFSDPDKSVLLSIFGENLYDFSGENEFTQSVTNYYETSHYRPSVGDSILTIIYR